MWPPPARDVREDLHPETGHLGHRGQLAALPAHGDGSGHAHVATGSGAQVEHLSDDRRAVDGRLRVGHGDNCGVAAEGGRTGPSGDGLRFFSAGLAQVGVQVHQAGSDHAAGCVQHDGSGWH
jgi:hypothetical protein